MTESIPEADQDQTPRKKKRSGLVLIREIFIVILGALVALAADDWQEANERAERDQQVLSMLKGELQTNLNNIKDSGDYHQTMLQEIEKSITTMREEGRFVFPDNWRNEAEIPTLNAAFQVALLGGTLSRIEPELALTLSSLYDELADFDQRRDQIDLSTIQTSFSNGLRYLTLKRVALEVEANYITEMVPLYQQAIDQIIQYEDS